MTRPRRTSPRSAVARRVSRRFVLPPGAAAGTGGGFWTFLWPAPCVVGSAFLIAWGAECAQFWVSRGMALAILAWLQALPEFAVEAVIAWSQHVQFMTANFTGSLRLLVGLGWPLIFAVAAFGAWRREGRFLRRIELDPENCVEVLALGLPILYFVVIDLKRSLTLVDAAILLAIYVAYLWALRMVPPREQEHIEDLEPIPRSIMRLPKRGQITVIVTLFIGGGLILYLSAGPFLQSMLHYAVTLGVSEYLFIQWVAPFLSEFPEKLSAMYWARQKGKAPMALMNMVSANINQWTMLAAMIPVVYSVSAGRVMFVPFDDHQRAEILLTVAQSLLGMLLLSNMSFHVVEAAGIFVLWFSQFVRPDLHTAVTLIYLAWSAVEVIVILTVRRRIAAVVAFVDLWRRTRGANGSAAPPADP
jgi:cation:H+ antiporter